MKPQAYFSRCAMVVCCLTILTLLTGSASATNIYWNSASAYWQYSTNWNPQQLPTSGDDAYIANSGTCYITASGSANNLYIGNSAGTLYVQSGDDLTLAGQMMLGPGGTGIVYHQAGTVSAASHVQVGAYSNGAGTYTMTGGSLHSGGTLYAGSWGPGVFSQNGGSVTAGSVNVGLMNNGTYSLWAGALNVSGTMTVNGSGDSFGICSGASATMGGYTQGSGATLYIQLSSASSYSKIQVNGNVSLAGTLGVGVDAGYTPADGQTWNIFGVTGTISGTLTCPDGYSLTADDANNVIRLTYSVPDIQTISVTQIESNVTYYGTFESHNQHVCSDSSDNYFMAYQRTENNGQSNNRIVRSTNGGSSFSSICDINGYHTRLPALEIDSSNDLYAGYHDYDNSTVYVNKFLASNNYGNPSTGQYSNVSNIGNKHSMILDAGRSNLYFFPRNGQMLKINPSNLSLRSTSTITNTAGSNACMMYPHCYLDSGGTVSFAWTTEYNSGPNGNYYDIHYCKTADGGSVWRQMDGDQLNLPFNPDNVNGANRLSLSDEGMGDPNHYTWLASMISKGGKVHTMYWCHFPTERFHYQRFNGTTGSKEIDMGDPNSAYFGDWHGETLSPCFYDGFFATNVSDANSSLYAVTKDNVGHIICIRSDDNGSTWVDHAKTTNTYTAYSISGCRQITPDGYIIGCFVDQNNGDHGDVYFLKFPK